MISFIVALTLLNRFEKALALLVTKNLAVDDGYTATESILLTVSAPGVLGNDTDAGLHGSAVALTAVLDTNVSNGTLALNADGSFVYTSDVDQCGTDSFTYHATDGADDSNSATVNINIICSHELTVVLDGSGEGSVSSALKHDNRMTFVR